MWSAQWRVIRRLKKWEDGGFKFEVQEVAVCPFVPRSDKLQSRKLASARRAEALLLIGSLRVFWDEVTDRVVLHVKLESTNRKWSTASDNWCNSFVALGRECAASFIRPTSFQWAQTDAFNAHSLPAYLRANSSAVGLNTV